MPDAIQVNPRDDVEFVALVDRLAAATNRADELQRLLRKTYPSAVVRPRGLEGERFEVWYVYRDGSWRGPGQKGEEA